MKLLAPELSFLVCTLVSGVGNSLALVPPCRSFALVPACTFLSTCDRTKLRFAAPPAGKAYGAVSSPKKSSDLSASASPNGAFSPREEKVEILKRAQRYLMGSRLVYLYAELRQLSYCRYAKTDFQTIDCNGENTSNITHYKFLNILLDELNNLIEKKIPSDYSHQSEEWRNYSWMLKALDESLSFVSDIEQAGHFLHSTTMNGTHSRDLEELKQTIQSIQSNKKLSSLLMVAKHKYTGSPEQNTLSRKLLNAYENAIRSLTNAAEFFWYCPALKRDTNFVDSREKTLFEELRSFSQDCLRKDAFFKDIFEDEIELVHFEDRYPAKECVYAITTNKDKARVTVIFRGTVNLNDWIHNFQVNLTNVPDPSRSAGSTAPDIGIHKGLHTMLLRSGTAKNNQTKFDQILTKAEDCAGSSNWTLSVTGHSLGGALATLFAFYAASDSRVRNPVEVFSFGSPFVGDKKFCEAFERLVSNGKLVHKRVENANDIATMWPFVAHMDVCHAAKRVLLHAPTFVRNRFGDFKDIVDTWSPASPSDSAKHAVQLGRDWVDDIDAWKNPTDPPDFDAWGISLYKHVGEQIYLPHVSNSTWAKNKFMHALRQPKFAEVLDIHSLSEYENRLSNEKKEHTRTLEKVDEWTSLRHYYLSSFPQISVRFFIAGTHMYFFIQNFAPYLAPSFQWFPHPLQWMSGQVVLLVGTILFSIWMDASVRLCNFERLFESRSKF